MDCAGVSRMYRRDSRTGMGIVRVMGFDEDEDAHGYEKRGRKRERPPLIARYLTLLAAFRRLCACVWTPA
jgi:hypothetical protein